jgi:hypothetical protein
LECGGLQLFSSENPARGVEFVRGKIIKGMRKKGPRIYFPDNHSPDRNQNHPGCYGDELWDELWSLNRGFL